MKLLVIGKHNIKTKTKKKTVPAEKFSLKYKQQHLNDNQCISIIFNIHDLTLHY